MVGAEEGDDPVAVEHLGVQLGVRLDQVQDREIGARLAQIGQHARGVADPDRDPDAGMARDEARDQVHDRERPVGADLQPAGAQLARGRHQLREIVELGEHAARPLPELAAELGQLDALAEAAEQEDAVALLERPHLHRDRRLADAETERAAREAAFARDGMERAELGKVHSFSLWEHHHYQFDLCERGAQVLG